MVSKPGASTVWGISAAVAARLDAGETPEQIVEEAMRMKRNDRDGDYWVWVLRKGSDEPMDEGPYGPHSWESAKTFARIGATEGEHDRAVSRGRDPAGAGFEIVRIYEAGSGEHIVKATPNGAPGPYTVREENTAIGSAHFRGTFDTLEEAEDYARRQARRSRNFVYFEVWRGTPRNAIEPVGERFQGGG